VVGPPKAYEVLGGPINNSTSCLWQHNKSFAEYVDVGQQVVRSGTIRYGLAKWSRGLFGNFLQYVTIYGVHPIVFW